MATDREYKIRLTTEGDPSGAEAVEQAVTDTAAAVEQADTAVESLQQASQELRENGLEEVAEALEAVGEQGADAAEALTEAAIKSRDLNSVATILRQAGLGPLADALTLVTRTTEQARIAKAAYATQAVTTANIVRTAFLAAIPVVGLLIGAVTGLVSWFRRTKDEAATLPPEIDRAKDAAENLRDVWPDIATAATSALDPIRQMDRELRFALDTQRALARALAAQEDIALGTRLLDIDEAEGRGELSPADAERERNLAKQESRARLLAKERELIDQEIAAQESAIATRQELVEKNLARLRAFQAERDALAEDEKNQRDAQNILDNLGRAGRAAEVKTPQATLDRLAPAGRKRQEERDRAAAAEAQANANRIRQQLESRFGTLENAANESAKLRDTLRKTEELTGRAAREIPTLSEDIDKAAAEAADLRASLAAEKDKLGRVRQAEDQAQQDLRTLEDRKTEISGREAEDRAAARQREAAERAAAEAEAAAATVEPTVPGDDPAIDRVVAVVETLIEDQRQRGAGDRPAVARLENAVNALIDGATGEELATTAAAIEQAMQTFATSTTANNAALRSLAAKVDNLQRQIATQAAR